MFRLPRLGQEAVPLDLRKLLISRGGVYWRMATIPFCARVLRTRCTDRVFPAYRENSSKCRQSSEVAIK